jgi:hypothetical protein
MQSWPLLLILLRNIPCHVPATFGVGTAVPDTAKSQAAADPPITLSQLLSCQGAHLSWLQATAGLCDDHSWLPILKGSCSGQMMVL